MAHPLSQRIADVLRRCAPDAPAIEFEGDWSTWGEVGELRRAASPNWSTRHGGQHAQVGVLLRNTPAHVATFLGVMLADATLVVINPSRGDDRTRADIAALDCPSSSAPPTTWPRSSHRADGTTIVTIADLDEPPP